MNYKRNQSNSSRSVLRRALLEGLEKRQLMTVVPPAFSLGLPEQSSVIGQYVGFGIPARPYNTTELNEHLSNEPIMGPLGGVWIETASNVVEGDSIRFEVRQMGVPSGLQVHYVIDSSTTLTPGNDFEQSSGVIEFSSPSTQWITVKTLDDLQVEDQEKLSIRLTTANTRMISVNSNVATVTIDDNDIETSMPVVGIHAPASSSLDEEQWLTFSRSSGDLSAPLTIEVLLTPQSGQLLVDGLALPIGATNSTSLVFPAGQDTARLRIKRGANEDASVIASIAPSSQYTLDVSYRKEIYFLKPWEQVLVDQITMRLDGQQDGEKSVVLGMPVTSHDVTFAIDDNLDNQIDRTISVPAGVSETRFGIYPSSTESGLDRYSIAYSVIAGSQTNLVWRRFTADAPAPKVTGQTKLDWLGLLVDTGDSTDLRSQNPILVGAVTGALQNPVRVLFDQNEDGTSDGSVFVNSGKRVFTFDPRSSSNLSPGKRTIGYRLESDEVWSKFEFEYLAAPLSELHVSSLSVVDVETAAKTLVSGSIGLPSSYINGQQLQKLGSSAGLSSNAEGNAATTEFLSMFNAAALVSVEIDFNGDLIADQRVSVGSDFTFKFGTEVLSPGTHRISVRPSEWNVSTSEKLVGAWRPIDVSVRSQFPQFNEFTVSEGKLVGSVSPSLRYGVNDVRIEFDENLDSVVDGYVLPDGSGQFSWSPAQSKDGLVRVRTNLIESVPGTARFGEWLDAQWSSTANTIPEVVSIGIVNIGANGIVIGPTADSLGRLSSSDDFSIEFDNNGDGTADQVAFPQADGQFSQSFTDLQAGTNTVRYRVRGWDAVNNAEYLGAWKSFQFQAGAENDVPYSSSESAGEPGDANGNLTFPISLIGNRIPEYSSVQIDFDADQDADQTLNVINGEFSIVKSTIPTGVTTIKARGVAYDDQELSEFYGPWVDIKLSDFYGGFPSLVSHLALWSDSGFSYEDGKTENVTIAGTMFSEHEGLISQAIVQVDENGDGVVDGATTTDSSGGFVYRPSFLPFGEVNVKFRPVTWSASSSTYKSGPWSSITFSHEDQVDQAAKVRSAVLSEPSAIGSSETQLASTLRGRVTNEAGLAGIVIEIDTNGDDQKDQVTTTDALGRFSAQIFGTSTAINATRIRVRELDPISRQVQFGPWVTPTQEFGGGDEDPNGSGNSGGNSGGGNSGGDDDYQDAINGANDAHETALAGAKGQYDAELELADDAYAAAVAAAGLSFQSAIGSFTGNSQSFDYRPIQWPSVPGSGVAFPDDASMPTPPAQKPTYSGEEYPFDTDAAYQSALAANRNAYNLELLAAKAALNAEKIAADNRHKDRVNAINSDYEEAVEDAQEQYEDDSEVDTTYLDQLAADFQQQMTDAWNAYQATAQSLGQDLNDAMTAAWNSLQSTIQSANDAYSSAINSAYQAYADATNHEGCTCDEERTASIDYSRAVYEAGKTHDKAVSQARNDYDHAIAALIKQHAYDIADAWETYQNAAIAAQDAYDKARNEFNQQSSQQQEDARDTLEDTKINLVKNKDKLIADSERIKAIEIALAEKIYTIRIENARVALWIANAQLKLATITAWHNSPAQSLWTAYQVQLASHELAYYQALGTQHVVYINQTATAEYDRQVARANAQHAYRYAMIDAEALRRHRTNGATHSFNNSEIARTRSSSDDDADDKKTMRDGQNDKTKATNSADAAYNYAIAVSDANHAYTTAMVDARQFIVTSNTCENRTADKRYPWSWAVVVVSFTAAANNYNTFVKALNQANHDLAVANINNGGSTNSALAGLWQDYQNAKRNRDTADSNARATDNRTRADSGSQGDYDYAIAVMAAQGVRSNAFSDADLAFANTTAPLGAGYEVGQTVLVGVRNLSDATSSKAFKVTSASQYSQAMTSWDATLNTAFTEYHQSLGTIELAWATESGDIEIDYVTSVNTANQTHSTVTSLYNSARIMANATTDDAFVALMVTARNEYAVEAGTAKLGRAQARSQNTETSAHNDNNNDKENSSDSSDRESSQWEALQDAEKTYQLAVLAAQLALANAQADANRDYAIATGQAWEDYFNEDIDYEGYLDALESAWQGYNDAMEAAYDAYNTAMKSAWDALRSAYRDAMEADAKGDADDAKDDVYDHQDENDRYVNSDATSAIQETVSLSQAAINLATKTANASMAKDAQIAENERVFTVDTATASKTKTDSMVGFTGVKLRKQFINNAAQREDQIAARGLYEVATYTTIANNSTSNAISLGTTLAVYQAAVANAEAVRADALRIARDAYEDSVSYAGLAEVDAINAADAAKNGTVGTAELNFTISVAAADKVLTIGKSEAYYALYLANAIAEARLREVLNLIAIETNLANSLASSDLQRGLADAANTKANALADAAKALQAALDADWQPIEWYGGGWGWGGMGWGGWYGGWGGWYGGWGGWYGGWGGWYGYGGYVFGYAGYGWGYYGGYGGFGGWYGGGWGWGGWYGGWYGYGGWGGWGLGWGYGGWGFGGLGWGWGGGGGLGGGDHGSDYDDYNNSVDDANDDYNNTVDGLNDDYEDAAKQRALIKATRNGDAAVAFATSRGIAGVQYVTAVNTADNIFTTTWTPANNLRGNAITSAARTHAYARSQASTDRTAAMGTADVAFQNLRGTALVNFAESSAVAEANYHISEANARAIQLQNMPKNGPRDFYETAYASATAQWITSIASSFVSHHRTSELAEQSYRYALADNLRNRNNLRSVSERTYTQNTADAEQVLGNSLRNSNVTADNDNDFASRSRRFFGAQADASYELGIANSERTYVIAVAQAGIDHETGSDPYDDAIDDALDERVINRANVGFAWSVAEHLARRSFSDTQSQTEHQRSVSIAANTYTFGLATADEAYDHAIRQAAVDRAYLQAETVARSSRNTTRATSDASYWTAEQTARVGAQSLMHSQMQLPWTQYLVAATQARQSWWNTVSPVYVQLANDRNVVESAYDVGIALDREIRATLVSSAERNHSKAISLITRNEALNSSDAILDYYTNLNPVTHTYLNRMSEIARDSAIESGLSDPPSNPTNWDALKSSASIAFLTTAQTIQNGVKSDLQSADFSASLDAIAADVALSRTKVATANAYKSAEIGRYVAKVANRSAVEKVYAQFETSSLASTLVSFASTNPSPWAVYDAADAVNRNVWTIATTNARAVFDNSAAGHQSTLESTIATTEANYFDALIVERGTPGPLNFAMTLTPSLPIPSVAPNLSGFYATIAAGNAPASISDGFLGTGSSSGGGSGSGGGSSGGSSSSGGGSSSSGGSQSSGGTIGGGYGDVGGSGGSDYGDESYGSTGGGSSSSASSGVNWDLIAEADAIQSLENTNELVDRYGIADIEDLLASMQSYSSESIVTTGTVTMDNTLPVIFTSEDAARGFGEASPEFKLLLEGSVATTLAAIPTRPEPTVLEKPQSVSPGETNEDRSIKPGSDKQTLDERQAELFAKVNKLLNEGVTVNGATVTDFVKGAIDGFIDGIKNGLGGMAVGGVIYAAKGAMYIQQQTRLATYHYLQLVPGIRQAGSWWMGYDIGANEEQALTEMMIQGVNTTKNVVKWTADNLKYAAEVYTEVRSLIARGENMLLQALLTGDTTELEEVINSVDSKASVVARQALEVARMALIEIGHAIVDMDAKTAGYIVGAIAYEAAESAAITAILAAMGVAEVGTGGAATPAVGAGVAGIVGAKAATFARLAHKLTKLDSVKAFPKVVKAIEKLQDIAVMAIRYPMCFVAGTKVHTLHGLKNIEEIKVGDRVLTRDENNATSPNRYRPVTELFRTSPNRLLTIRIIADGEVEEVACTGQHPFYVRREDTPAEAKAVIRSMFSDGKASSAIADSIVGYFVPADELSIGDELLLADGRSATILYIDEQLAADGETYTTYNFAVEGDHTYFVSKLGVWVHNTGNPCDEAFEKFVSLIRSGKGQTEAYIESLKLLLKNKKEGKALIKKHVKDLANYVTEAITHTLKKDYPDAPDELVNLVARKKHIHDEDIGDIFGGGMPVDELDDLLDKEIVGNTGRKGVPNKPGSIQEHHIIPDEVRARAEAAGVNIDDFTIAMDYENHVGSKVGIHHMFAPDEIDELTGVVKKSAFDKKYNEAWDSFFRDDVGNIVERSPKEILEFAQHMVEKYGIDGM